MENRLQEISVGPIWIAPGAGGVVVSPGTCGTGTRRSRLIFTNAGRSSRAALPSRETKGSLTAPNSLRMRHSLRATSICSTTRELWPNLLPVEGAHFATSNGAISGTLDGRAAPGGDRPHLFDPLPNHALAYAYARRERGLADSVFCEVLSEIHGRKIALLLNACQQQCWLSALIASLHSRHDNGS